MFRTDDRADPARLIRHRVAALHKLNAAGRAHRATGPPRADAHALPD